MKIKNCLHCGIEGNVFKVRAGLCDYCKSIVTTHQRNAYKGINNGSISYCYVCDDLTLDGEKVSGVKTENIVCETVCAKCDKAFAV